MSKRLSVGQSNTLFNYFQSPKGKSPQIKKEIQEIPTKRLKETTVEDSEDDAIQAKKRYRRIISSDSESENESPNENKNQVKKQKIENSKDIEPSIPLNKFKFKEGNHKASDINGEKDERESVPKSKNVTDFGDAHSNWLHNRLEFLQPDKIRDANKRKPNDPDYDPRTLYVPEEFLNGLTPAMRQWWILKKQHMDTVLFFKVGKFYELYHMDAVVGVQQLGFSYMKGEFAHSGFPEGAYAKMAMDLINKGFKVARVEQTETPELMNERLKQQKKVTKFDKVVKREICQISAKGCCVLTSQMPEARNEQPMYMCAVAVKQEGASSRYGVCFLDTSIGKIHLGEFEDDKHCSRLLSLFAEYPPVLILSERGAPYTHLTELLNSTLKDVRHESLHSKSQFYNASSTLELLASSCYFKDSEGHFEWPLIFKEMADDCIPKSEYELCIRALGACTWYLKDCETDIQVLSMKKFEKYVPNDLKASSELIRDYLILDSTTMNNLCLLGGKGSLQKTLDFCQTAFGKRLLKQWICRPLCDIKKIKQRQEAVKELWNNPSLLRASQDVLKKLPDLERQISKIHSYGNKFLALYHPDSRAIFYEAKTYSKRRIVDLLKTLKGFEKAQDIAKIFKDCKSNYLRRITQYSPDGVNVDLSEDINFFKEAFNHEEAEKEGKIVPKAGVDAQFDQAENEIKKINQRLEEYLAEQCEFFGCKVTYFGNDKKRFQLEVPEHRTNRVNSDYQLEGTKKGAKPCKRYSTSVTKALLADMLRAEGERAKALLDVNRRIFEKFGERRDRWDRVVMCLMMLDVLGSFAEYAITFAQDMCMPEVEPFGDKVEIEIENGRHPCVQNIDTFVPNDTKMGVGELPKILVVTGPNMGGKSTLMRQIAIISVMAQLGCTVPASKCKLTLIDRIFTRIGANDDIVQGQSTFFVELSEASSILKHASQHSLVLIDELGRGTSTHDGNAIATAYLKKLIEMDCRTLFSTHYHSLVDHFIGCERTQLVHMACLVENDDDPTQESVTFLYKLAAGRCPKSYGFNAARLAGLQPSIVQRGIQIAAKLEQNRKSRELLLKLLSTTDLNALRECISQIKQLQI